MGVVYSNIAQSFKEEMAGEFALDFTESSQISEYINERFGGEGCAKTRPQGARAARDLAGYFLRVD